MTWVHYPRIKLSWFSEVNIGKGVWMLLEEMKSFPYMVIFILCFVCFSGKWAHIYLLSIEKGIELLKNCMVPESLLPGLTLLLLHSMERTMPLSDFYLQNYLVLCPCKGKKWGKQQPCCWVSSGGSALIPVPVALMLSWSSSASHLYRMDCPIADFLSLCSSQQAAHLPYSNRKQNWKKTRFHFFCSCNG